MVLVLGWHNNQGLLLESKHSWLSSQLRVCVTSFKYLDYMQLTPAFSSVITKCCCPVIEESTVSSFLLFLKLFRTQICRHILNSAWMSVTRSSKRKWRWIYAIILWVFMHSWHAEGDAATTIMAGKLRWCLWGTIQFPGQPGEYSKLMVSKRSRDFAHKSAQPVHKVSQSGASPSWLPPAESLAALEEMRTLQVRVVVELHWQGASAGTPWIQLAKRETGFHS